MIVRLAQNEAIIPSQKKDELLCISLESGLVTSIPLQFNATLFDLKLSPCGSRLIVIDRKKSIHCIDAEQWSVVWSTSLKKQLGAAHMGVGQFSGDGALFGAAVSGNNGNYTLVVDAESGETRQHLRNAMLWLAALRHLSPGLIHTQRQFRRQDS